MRKCWVSVAVLALVLPTPIVAQEGGRENTKVRYNCHNGLLERTTLVFAQMANTKCMEMLSDRSEPRRLLLKAENRRCTSKRVGSISRKAGRLYEAAKEGKDRQTIWALAQKLRNTARGRSSMYSSCFKTMVNSLDDSYEVTVYRNTF